MARFKEWVPCALTDSVCWPRNIIDRDVQRVQGEKEVVI